MSIPKIIHQTWKRRRIPRRYSAYVASWRRHHPDWEFRLWTDAANRQFIADHYPKFLRQFDDYPYPIQRADAIRYFLLHHFGGLYVDLDFLCLRPVDPVLAGSGCVLSLEPAEHCQHFQRDQIVGNAIMAAAPGHPLFRSVIEQLPYFADRVHLIQGVLETTGPFMLSNVYADCPASDTATLLPAKYFNPLSQDEAEEYRRSGRSSVPLDESYGVHLHFGSWWRDDPLRSPVSRSIRAFRHRVMRRPRQLLRSLVSSAAARTGVAFSWLHF